MARYPRAPEYRYSSIPGPDELDAAIWDHPNGQGFPLAYFYEGHIHDVELLREATDRFTYMRDIFGEPHVDWECAKIEVKSCVAGVIYTHSDAFEVVARLLERNHLLQFRSIRKRPLIRVKWRGDERPFREHSIEPQVPLWVHADPQGKHDAARYGVRRLERISDCGYRTPQVYRLGRFFLRAGPVAHQDPGTEGDAPLDREQ